MVLRFGFRAFHNDRYPQETAPSQLLMLRKLKIHPRLNSFDHWHTDRGDRRLRSCHITIWDVYTVSLVIHFSLDHRDIKLSSLVRSTLSHDKLSKNQQKTSLYVSIRLFQRFLYELWARFRRAKLLLLNLFSSLGLKFIEVPRSFWISAWQSTGCVEFFAGFLNPFIIYASIATAVSVLRLSCQAPYCLRTNVLKLKYCYFFVGCHFSYCRVPSGWSWLHQCVLRSW